MDCKNSYSFTEVQKLDIQKRKFGKTVRILTVLSGDGIIWFLDPDPKPT